MIVVEIITLGGFVLVFDGFGNLGNFALVFGGFDTFQTCALFERGVRVVACSCKLYCLMEFPEGILMVNFGSYVFLLLDFFSECPTQIWMRSLCRCKLAWTDVFVFQI